MVIIRESHLHQQGHRQIGSPHLVLEDLPAWMQSDPYIRRGYRPQLDSFTACGQSIFYIHNESVNIWTHLLPTSVYVVVLLLTDYSTLHNGIKLSSADNAALHAYIVGAIACLTFSVGLSPREPMGKPA